MNRSPLSDLGRALRLLGEHGDRLGIFEAAPEQLEEIGADLTRAHKLLTAARAAAGPSGCRIHRDAPTDPAADGACLFCTTNRRRGQLTEQATVTATLPLETVARAVADLGQDEAVRRYGPRTVTRALLRHRFDPTLTEESA